jgi:SAM-dependent methyltransferase
MPKQIYYPESRFGGFTNIDGTILFYIRVKSLVKPDSIILDYGCGRGGYIDDPVSIRRELRIFKGKVCRVIGMDVDPHAGENPFLDEFHLINSDQWPLKNESVDIIICDNVLEHLEKPSFFFKQSRRVLKNKGYLCIRTSNSWNYIGLLARLFPERLHSVVISKVQERRKEFDVFPKYYKCNTIPRLKAILSMYDFEHVVFGYEAEPSYLSFSRIAYLFGVIHQRLAPGFMRPSIFAFAEVHK